MSIRPVLTNVVWNLDARNVISKVSVYKIRAV